MPRRRIVVALAPIYIKSTPFISTLSPTCPPMLLVVVGANGGSDSIYIYIYMRRTVVKKVVWSLIRLD